MAQSDVDRYIAATDNANDYADAQVAGLNQKALEDIDDLFRESTRRDPELWAELGVEADAVVGDYDAVAVDQRDLDWSLGFAGLSAASLYQFSLDNRDDVIIKPLAYRSQKMDGFALTQAELVTIGKRGAELAGQAQFEALQAKYLNEWTFLRELDNTTLYKELLDVGAIAPIDHQIAQAQGYVARMTNYPPGSPQFKTAVSDLVDYNSSRALKGVNRRAVEQLYTLSEVAGDEQKLMAWIVEGGKNICEFCEARAGQVMSYISWISEGLPGSDVCKGGDLCRCHLAAV